MAKMTSTERVIRAFEFKAPDRIPRFDSFWDYPESWKAVLGPFQELSDVEIRVPDEGAFCTRARPLKEESGWVYAVDPWGRTVRSRRDTFFSETLEVPIPEGTDPETIVFDDPALEERYFRPADGVSFIQMAQDAADAGMKDPGAEVESTDSNATVHRVPGRCVFGKTGGPYLRTTYVRGETQFLMDIASDPPLARTLADKMADHLLKVGREEIRRWNLAETGIWIYDDMAYNDSPMFSPVAFERIFLPAYRRMIQGFKEAGARWVGLHSDGNILPILDMLVDAGIDALNPLERRAHMDVLELRKRYPDLVLTGGMDNTGTLVEGPPERIEREAREIIDLGREGGVVIGSHSISPEIPLEHFLAYQRICRSEGVFEK